MRSRKSVYYIGGQLGGTQRNRTYYSGVRPNEAAVVKARQALTRRYGQEAVAISRGSVGGAHTANSEDPGTITTDAGLWNVGYLEIADNDAVGEVFNFGTATGIAAIFGWMEIKRNYGTPRRELRTIRLAQVNSSCFLGTEIDRDSSDNTTGVTIVASISGGDLVLTITTDNATPDATAEVQLLYTVLEET